MIWKWETTKSKMDEIGYIKFYMGKKAQTNAKKEI